MLSISYASKQQKQARNIIIELMQTESTYIRALKYYLDNYYKEFTDNVNKQPKYLKGKEATIFANLKEIQALHDKSVDFFFFKDF